MPRALTPLDVFSFQSVSDPRISGDASRIVATLTRRDIATDRRVTTLTETHDHKTWAEIPDSQGVLTARLAPHGQALAFIRRTGDTMQLIVRDNGKTTSLHEAAHLRQPAWSPDGTIIAFQQRIDAPLPDWLGFPLPPQGADWSPPPRHADRLLYRHDAVGELPDSVFHIFVIPADGSTPPRQITHGTWHNGFPAQIPPGLVFTADGIAVLIAGTQRPDWDVAPNRTDIYRIALADGAVTRLTETAGSAAFPHPSPDGSLIAFTAIHDTGLSHHRRRLMVMPAKGGPPREILPDLDRSIGEIAWSGDGLIVCYDDEGATHLAHVSLDGTLRIVARNVSGGQIEMPYSGQSLSVSDNGTIAYVASTTDLPSEVALITPDGTTLLTTLNADLAHEVGGFHTAEEIWTQGGEGRQMQSWLMLPKAPGPHPLILQIHGGPYAQFGARFSIKNQILAAAGFAVLYCNPAGSTGYGEAFTSALHDRFPGPDHDDLMAAIDIVAARPEIDETALFITGVSGGGVLTLWAVTHNDRFRAAVAIKPVVDWQSWLLSADIGPSVGLRWMGDAKPWEAPEKYRERSPLTHAHKAKTPTLLMAGDTDSRTPMSETLQMYAALRLAGVDAHLLRFPGTSHSSSSMRPSLFASEITATIGWFEKHRRTF